MTFTTQDATHPQDVQTQPTKKFVFILKEYDSIGHFFIEVVKTLIILNILMYISITLLAYIYMGGKL